MSIRILICGMNGRMGQQVTATVTAGYRDTVLVAGVDTNPCTGSVPCYTSLQDVTQSVDCIIDFSHHSATASLTDYACRRGIPLVIATTGQTEDELAMIRSASEQIPVFFSANYSLGVALLVELAKKAAAAMPDADIEIVEKHHNRKLDAPSGTALMIANAIRTVREKAQLVCGRSGMAKRTPEEIGIHAVRMGNIIGEHEVLIGTDSQTITIKHEAHSRSLFAEGAVAAAAFLVGQRAGLYDMKSLLG
ncbi:MAG: 4-hydroxy-tetrahydrodipicolinate reductase [Clostridia bacterium]|nr:4-hydroxy-tetrahydrodipicolinate reductase [Clostridia bacterium]